MNTQKAYYVGTGSASFRPGEAAEIVAVVFAEVRAGTWRACYQIEYADGVKDYCAIDDRQNYRLTNSVRSATVAI